MFVLNGTQREFVKKLPFTFKYTNNEYFYKGCIIFAFNFHTTKNRIQIFSSTLDNYVMADNPVRKIDAFAC